jgi:hypothetical protein
MIAVNGTVFNSNDGKINTTFYEVNHEAINNYGSNGTSVSSNITTNHTSAHIDGT